MNVAAAPHNTATECCSNCNLPVDSKLDRGYCSCGSPWTRCGKCGNAVSPLWSFCPLDGSSVGEHFLTQDRGAPKIDLLGRQTFKAAEPIYQAPVAYGGFLWVLTVAGNLFRISPATLRRHKLIEDFGRDYGIRGMAVVPEDVWEAKRSVRISRTSDDRKLAAQPLLGSRLLIGAIGKDRVALIDPAVHQVEDSPVESPVLSAGSHFIDVDTGCPALAAIGQRFAALAWNTEGPALWIWNKRTGEQESFNIPAMDVYGPTTVGDAFVCYSSSTVYLIRSSSVESFQFPRGFLAATRSTEDEIGLKLPWGRPPYVRVLDGLYIPGSLDGQSAFVFLEINNSAPGIRTVIVQEKGAYRRGGPNSLLLTNRGSLRLLKHAAIFSDAAYSDDPQIAPEAAAYAGNLAAMICRTSIGEMELRLYPGGEQRVEIHEKIVPVEIFLLPQFIVLVYITEDNHLEIASWPLV
jgi:hypothetical protein